MAEHESKLRAATALAMREFDTVVGRTIRVWDLIGYASGDNDRQMLVRISFPTGISVRVRSRTSQEPAELFRTSRGKLRPRWMVVPVERKKELGYLQETPLYVRAPSIIIDTGKREDRFRYMLIG